MFENIFSKGKNLDAAPPDEPDASLNAAHEDAAAAAVSAEESEDWQARIRAAASDDAALLSFAHEAPTVPLKLAAIEALTQEQSFKQAMHDFREHDKRLYRAAKSRWQAASGTRETTAAAHALIAGARALQEQEMVPVNRVVELDRAWAELNEAWLDAALAGEFSTLSTQLGEKVRAHGEHAQALTRWLSAVDSASEQLSAVLPGIAQGELAPAVSEPLAVSLLELARSVPDADDARCIDKSDAANRLLALASSVVQRADFLRALPATGVVDEADEKQRIEQWRAFPEVSEGQLHTVLAHRFADWRNASVEERQREHDAQDSRDSEQRREQNRQRVAALQREIEAAEAAHAAGHVAELTRLLGAIDHALKRGPVNAALTQRIETLRREQKRLHDWQRWSGGQGREQLATEAQALAEAAAGKISIKAHTEAIEKLRERWKELDKLGAASNQSVWLTFDGALNTAYAPVAAHLEKLKAARAENLAAREKIVESLSQSAAKFFPAAAATADGTPAPDAKPDWRAVSHELEAAQLAWRKLGPVEHTVPRKSLQGAKAVTTRYAAAVQALEGPLKGAYGDARQQREQLIAAAKELSASATARDVVDKVRKLQTQWQAVAKSLPLPRRDENALWTAFKGATDAIFAAKDAARAASEAEFSAKTKARDEIIDKLSALAQGNTVAEIKRAIADAETAWRAAPEVPKSHTAKLDARYRAARDAATKRLGDLALHATQARYDALIAKMALCDEREKLLDASDSNGTLSEEQAADLEARWNTIEHFPDAWKAKLDARFAGLAHPAPAPAGKSGKTPAEGLPEILLNLEVACGIDSPPAFHAARQLLKMRALKTAMEGRQATVTTPADIERWMLEAGAYPRPDAGSRERLEKIIAAVRRRR